MDYKEKLEEAKRLYETANAGQRYVLESLFPELAESEDERVRKALLEMVHDTTGDELWVDYNVHKEDALAWLEKQGEQKPTQEIEPFEAEHGKYYYCIKDYFCGGRKQASKGDIVQALRGLPIMGLKDAGEYFLPVNSIKCNSAWSEEDEEMLRSIIATCELAEADRDSSPARHLLEMQLNWLKSIKDRCDWKPSDEQIKVCKEVYADILSAKGFDLGTVNSELNRLEEQLKKLREDKL